MTTRDDPPTSSARSADTLPPGWRNTLDAFAEFQRKHRGICDATIRNHLRVLHRFSDHVSPVRAPLAPAEISSEHIDWQDLRRHTGIDGGAAGGPRIHDLRHSFATLRLAA